MIWGMGQYWPGG